MRVQACLRKALHVAPGLELRAATQPRRAVGTPRLAPGWDRFTEGFDTADLKDAKDLLEALA